MKGHNGIETTANTLIEHHTHFFFQTVKQRNRELETMVIQQLEALYLPPPVGSGVKELTHYTPVGRKRRPMEQLVCRDSAVVKAPQK